MSRSKTETSIYLGKTRRFVAHTSDHQKCVTVSCFEHVRANLRDSFTFLMCECFNCIFYLDRNCEFSTVSRFEHIWSRSKTSDSFTFWSCFKHKRQYFLGFEVVFERGLLHTSWHTHQSEFDDSFTFLISFKLKSMNLLKIVFFTCFQFNYGRSKASIHSMKYSGGSYSDSKWEKRRFILTK